MRKVAVALGCVSLIACERSRADEPARVTKDDTLVPISATPAPAASSPCPDDMRLADGEYCPEVEQRCLRWLDTDQRPEANSRIGPMRCAEFAPSKCLSKTRQHVRVCLDTYEWPNREHELPLVTIDWFGAKAKCEQIGKRLCTATEWTFACEGSTMKPYPYGDGLHRDESTCDQQHDSMNPTKPRIEWQKYNHSHPSGSFPLCKSEFGVFDLTSNVDEWVHNVGGRADGDPYFSGLKGGYWTFKVRTRCRPMTTAHGPTHSFYQQGFRCCRDAQ
jgi:sulfatase modifying factor 1